MAKKKKAAQPAATPMNAAPGYGAPPLASGTYGNPYGQPAPGGQQAAPGGAQATFTAPPPRAPQNPFVNAQFLYQFGKPMRATIQGIRPAVGGNSKYGERPGWFFDFQLENGVACVGRINIGDQRHQRLFAAFGDKPIGRSVILRLPNPADTTKAAWTLDAA